VPGFDWRDYLALAKTISAGNQPSEACSRSGISRAYYSAFCSARNLLIQSGVTLPKVDPHRFVWEFYNWVGDPTTTRVSRLGFKLKRRRVHADYDGVYSPGFPNQLPRDVQYSLQDAEELLNAMPGVGGGTLLTAVAKFNRTGRMI
jgi:uncharacterized protein (UPF0332 family)